MQVRRVVITGMGAISPFGQGVSRLFSALKAGESGISILEQPPYVNDHDVVPGVAGLVKGIDITQVPRQHRRSMSPMSVYGLLAAQEALAQANLSEDIIKGGRLGVTIGSTMGSVNELEQIFKTYLPEHRLDGLRSTFFFKIMGHSVASNVAQTLGITGRVSAPSAACTSGAQSIGLAYETIAYGIQDYMLCGGADEYHPLTPATFDVMSAASCGYNDRPDCTPRPFDQRRDGVVCAEGAGVILLETYESAVQRGANILAELVGFASTCDTSSIANPDPVPLSECMQKALDQAQIKASSLSYVNAHATGTKQGDIAESKAIAMLCGDKTPVSSLKGHLGHTMAASGAIETIACVEMLVNNLVLPTRNLETLDEACSGIMHVQQVSERSMDVIIKNSFALGGINSSLVLRKLYE